MALALVGAFFRSALRGVSARADLVGRAIASSFERKWMDVLCDPPYGGSNEIYCC